MKLTFLLFVVLIIVSVGVQADVFKCQSSKGKTIYQPEPCALNTEASVVDVKPMTAVETAQAQERLRQWQDRQAIEEANQMTAKKEQQEKLQQQQAQANQERQGQTPKPNKSFWPFSR